MTAHPLDRDLAKPEPTYREHVGGLCRVALLLLAIACGGYQQVPPQVAVERAIASGAALTAWEKRVGPAPSCLPVLAAVGWLSLDTARFKAFCPLAPEGADGCTSIEQGGSIVIALRTDQVFTQATLDRVRAHELVHVMMHCSGRVPFGDGEHRDAFIWPAQVDATVLEMP